MLSGCWFEFPFHTLAQPAAIMSPQSPARLLLALPLLLTAPIALAADPAYFDLNQPAATQAAQYVELDNPAKLAGVGKLVIPQFRIEFQTRAEASSASGGYRGGSGSASAHVHLKGLDDALFQKVTDYAYASFKAKLAAAGLEAIGPESLAEEAEYQPILKVGKPSPAELETKDSVSRFFAPAGGRVYTLLRQTDKDRQGFMSGLSSGFEDTGKELPKAELALARKFNAPCLKVLLTVRPAQVNAGAIGGGGLIGAVGAAVNLAGEKAQPGLTLTEESRFVFRSAEHSENDFKMFGGKRFFGNKVRDFSQEGDSAIFLKKDVIVAESISDGGLQETTSAARKVGNVLAIATALTLGVSDQHHEYTVDAHPDKFVAVVTRELDAAFDMLIARLIEARQTTVTPAADPGKAAE